MSNGARTSRNSVTFSVSESSLVCIESGQGVMKKNLCGEDTSSVACA